MADLLVFASLVAAAVTLGCQELFDGDVWWHVASGRWILEHRDVPRLDPFSFASADRRWIDLHWVFQVLLATAHRAWGVPGIVVFASMVCATSVAIAMAPGWGVRPRWLAACLWIPALLVTSQRFDPRPEIFSLLYIAAFVRILEGSGRRPALAWLLPPIQVLWVNSHGLFILGPIILGLSLADRAVERFRIRRVGPLRSAPKGGGESSRVLLFAAVVAACFVNPYGWRGVLFPLELFPKITAWGGPYKEYIGEFMDLATYVKKQSAAVAASNLYFRGTFFLLTFLPVSFLIPAVWGARRANAPEAFGSGSVKIGHGALAIAIVLSFVASAGLPGLTTPSWLAGMARLVPIGFLAEGAAGALALGRRTPRAALLSALAGAAVGAWLYWMRDFLLGPEPGPLRWLGGARSFAALLLLGLLVIPTLALTLHTGGRPSRILLSAAFGYLQFQAIRNGNLFGLVAGTIIVLNLRDWTARLTDGSAAPSPSSRTGLVASLSLGFLIVAWMIAIVDGRFYKAAGELRAFGLREQPLAYAHSAAKFAGRPGMPDRALVFDLRQTGVYVHHNGPRRKIFMDARLEVPSRSTFESYVRLDDRLNRGAPGWSESLRRMGDPLVLLDHVENPGAEATLLADSRWRCVFYDEAASIFLPRRGGLEAQFPTVDLAAGHFLEGRDPTRPHERGLAAAEAKALFELGSALRLRKGGPWKLRIPVLLVAADRARVAISERPENPWGWTLLGHCCWSMIPDLGIRPDGPDEPWDPATGLAPARASYCYRHALALDPKNVWAWLSLYESFEKRRMNESLLDIRRRPSSTASDEQPESGSMSLLDSSARWSGSHDGPDDKARAISLLIDQGRAESAARLVRKSGRRVVLTWAVAERVAATFLHLGEPDLAFRTWEVASRAPSPALRSARLAVARLVALDEPGAERLYREALSLDDRLGDAWFGLATSNLLSGRAMEALRACRRGLSCELDGRQRTALEGIAALLERYVPGPRGLDATGRTREAPSYSRTR